MHKCAVENISTCINHKWRQILESKAERFLAHLATGYVRFRLFAKPDRRESPEGPPGEVGMLTLSRASE